MPGFGVPAKVLDQGLNIMIKSLSQADKALKPYAKTAKKLRQQINRVFKLLKKLRKYITKIRNNL